MKKTHSWNKGVQLLSWFAGALALALLALGCHTNISAQDTTPPAEVTELTAAAGNGKVSLSWTNPADADLYQVEITASPAAGSLAHPVYLSAEKGKTMSFTAEGLTNGTAYTFTVKTIDKALNKSKDGVSKTVTTNAASSVMSITLAQAPEKTIWTKDSVTITVKSSTSIKEAKWKKGAASAKDVLESGTAITGNSFTVTVNGIYSVAVLDNDGRREVETIEIKNIDKIAPQAPMNLTAEYRLGEKKIILKWSDPVDTGSGLKELNLSYTVNGAHETTETIAKGVQTFGIEQVNPQSPPVPYAFSLKAVDNAGNEGAAATVSVTPSEQAEITGISIPKAGTGYAGNKLPVTIKGKNFTAQGISAASFSGTLALSDIKIVSDTLVTATVDCPYTAGETNLTVTCTPTEGASVQGSEKIIVKDYTAYTVGKIVLADKTVVDKDSYTGIGSSNPPVAIICGTNGYGAAVGIALHTSGNDLVWAKDGSTGYNTKFEGIICKPSTTGSGAAETATFTGDTDGSDNWEYIKSIDPAGAADAATNYPAFHWVNQYNTQYAAQLGGTNFAWYMPSLAELCEVYKNRAVINESLTKIRGLDSNYADESLGTSWYWSSSQYSNGNYFAWYVSFSYGYVSYDNKSNNDRVSCLAGF